MANTLTVTRRSCEYAGGLVEEKLTIKELRTNLQGSHETIVERSTFRAEAMTSEHLLAELCPHYRRCTVKKPPHATQRIAYAVPIEGQRTFESVGDATQSPKCWNVSEMCIFEEIQRLRMRPEEYVEELRSRKREVVGSTLWTSSGAVRLTEGVAALDEAIAATRAFADSTSALTQKSDPSSLSSGLCLAAQDLALDVGPKGLILQRGTDESTVRERVERYGTWIDHVSEIAIFGVRDAVDVVCHILINDGVPSRIHRNLLLNLTLPEIGVCLCPHASASCCVVIVLAGQFVPRKPSEMLKARAAVTTHGAPSLSCAYCFGKVEARQCWYAVGGLPFHRHCLLCKVCKSSLRHTYYERRVPGNETPEALCKDCMLFRSPPKCCLCATTIVYAKEQYRKNGNMVCERCFLSVAGKLAEPYSHEDGEGELKCVGNACPATSALQL